MISPKTSSSKLWSGLLGIIATHCVLQAQTFVKVQILFLIERKEKNYIKYLRLLEF